MGQVAHVSTIYLMDTTLKDFLRFFLSATKFYNGNHFTSKGHLKVAFKKNKLDEIASRLNLKKAAAISRTV